MTTISDIYSLIGAIGGVLGTTFGGIGMFLNWKTHRDIKRPKIKLNIIKNDEKSVYNDYDLIIENISLENLYDFSVKLKELDQLDCQSVIKGSYIFKSIIPNFNIGQKYRTYLFNPTKCKDRIQELNFIIQYRLKPKRKIYTEHYIFNINAFRNVSIKYREENTKNL
ncbi:hypothetical protein ACFO6R_06310 [Eubacterium multiforme]|uniref:Uncharacterized protein n=1 Tax=Eubacterium multiforme TaxID=83339 RepID=A0ABT9USC0_9FIRM|nr:hypothetical protein [Eubacterium multiforme]MDQ0149206.1 hypothetical protein [Eubacterium multiforme]